MAVTIEFEVMCIYRCMRIAWELNLHGITWEHFARNCNAFELFGLGIMHSMCMCMLSAVENLLFMLLMLLKLLIQKFSIRIQCTAGIHPPASSYSLFRTFKCSFMCGKRLAETIPIEMLLAMWCESQAMISVPAHTHTHTIGHLFEFTGHMTIWAFARPSSTGSYCFQRTFIRTFTQDGNIKNIDLQCHKIPNGNGFRRRRMQCQRSPNPPACVIRIVLTVPTHWSERTHIHARKARLNKKTNALLPMRIPAAIE